jgi:hypothetical protein
MKDEVLKRLDVLAAKLGVAVGHVLEIATRQAYIDGWRDLGFAVLWAVLCVIAVRKFALAPIELDSFKCWSEQTCAKKIGGSLVSVLLGLLALCAFYVAIGEIYNPEYYAFKMIAAFMKESK